MLMARFTLLACEMAPLTEESGCVQVVKTEYPCSYHVVGVLKSLMEPSSLSRSGPGTEGRGNRPDGVVVPESSKVVNQERPLGLRRTAHQARVERATASAANQADA